MTSDTEDDRPAHDVEQEMGERADSMQSRLEELGDHVDDASRKADVAREIAGPDDAAPVRAVTGEESEDGGAQDDPTAMVNQPGEAEV